jgi:hypothetical protein
MQLLALRILQYTPTIVSLTLLLARLLFYAEDRGETFLRNFGS